MTIITVLGGGLERAYKKVLESMGVGGGSAFSIPTWPELLAIADGKGSSPNTQSHVDYVVEVVQAVYDQRTELRPLRMTWQAPFLRHFTARFEPAE